MTWLFSFKKSLKFASAQHSSFGTLIMKTTPGLVGLVLMLLVSVETKSSQEQSLQIDRIEFDNTEKLQEDIYDVEDRNGPGAKISNKISKMQIYQNHLVRVQDLGLTWKLQFDITLYKQPAYDKDGPINIFHLTQNGNDDKDNILKFSLVRQGSHGKFIFKYWTHTKTLLFSMGTPYHIIIELYRSRRGKKYQFAIDVDDDSLVNQPLKDIKIVPRTYKNAKLYCSNPWEKTLTSKIGAVSNFVIPTGKSRQCCNTLALVIKSSEIKLQKEKIGKYIYKGDKNGRGYWESMDGVSAIWYYPKYRDWMIGSKCYLGTQFRGVSAGQTSVACPNQNHKRWKYWNGHKWITDQKSQIDLVCVDDYSEQKDAVAITCPKSTSTMAWINGSSVKLGCIGFARNQRYRRGNGPTPEAECKKANSKAHLIEIFNEAQQRFLMSKEVQKEVQKAIGFNTFSGRNYWIGAEYKSGTWKWIHSKKPVKYVSRIGHNSWDSNSGQYGWMYFNKNHAYWGKSTSSCFYPICQISY